MELQEIITRIFNVHQANLANGVESVDDIAFKQAFRDLLLHLCEELDFEENQIYLGNDMEGQD